jgi:hypothetical protein
MLRIQPKQSESFMEGGSCSNYSIGGQLKKPGILVECSQPPVTTLHQQKKDSWLVVYCYGGQ